MADYTIDAKVVAAGPCAGQVLICLDGSWTQWQNGVPTNNKGKLEGKWFTANAGDKREMLATALAAMSTRADVYAEAVSIPQGDNGELDRIYCKAE